MVRIREILDPELRKKVLGALAERRGCSSLPSPTGSSWMMQITRDLLNDLKTTPTRTAKTIRACKMWHGLPAHVRNGRRSWTRSWA